MLGRFGTPLANHERSAQRAIIPVAKASRIDRGFVAIVPLRTLALASNVLFGIYGLLAHVYPVFVLHMILLPINLAKLYQIRFQK